MGVSSIEFYLNLMQNIEYRLGRDISVGIATGWTVRGSNPGGDEIFRTCPDRPWGPSNLLYNGYRVYPRGKERPGREADPSAPSSAVFMKGYSYTSTPLRAVRPVQSLSACTKVTFIEYRANFRLQP